MRKLLLVLVLTTLSLLGASFDFSKAKSDVEKAICQDDELSKLDEKLSLIFKEALQSTENKEQLKKEQLAWMKERNTCKDTVCIQTHYTRQIQTLSKIILENAEAQKFLVLGDSYFTSYQQSNNEDDKIKGLETYKKYVELLRTQNPLPKVPFRVVEEVYLKHKLELPYPDVWGYQFGDCKFGDVGSSINYLKNDDYYISYFEENPKATTTIERYRVFLFFSQVEIVFSDKAEYSKFDPYWDRNFPISSHFESIFSYKNPLKVGIERPEGYFPFSQYVHIMDGEGKEYQYHPMLYCDKQILGYSLGRYMSDGDDDVNLTTHVADVASSGHIIPLKDESFLIRNGFTVVRFTKEGFSKAPFFNKTFFMPTHEEYYAFYKKYVKTQEANNHKDGVVDGAWWFGGGLYQSGFDAAFEYLKSKKLIQGK